MRVLVVDDDDRIRKIVSLMLSDDRLEFVDARGGQEALDLLAKDTYDLMILDLMMPGVDGMQVLRETRANPQTADLPIIILTAMTGDRPMLEGFQGGANYYINKPFEPRELVDSVELILGIRLEP
jgi:two-component system response regulator ResD